MKSVFLFIGLAFMLTSFSAMGQTEEIVRSLKSANAENVGSHFEQLIDIKFLNKAEVKNMSKTQATIALKTFFVDYNINGFEKTSEREIGNTMYITGKLLNNDKGYNITVMLKQKGGHYVIVSLRIN